MLELYRFFKDLSIVRDRITPTLEDMKFDPLDKKKFESLKDFLQESNMKFNITGLVETWLKDRPHEYFEMEGYKLELTNRQNKDGVGVCLYIDENKAYSLRNDSYQIKHPDYTESLFIEIKRNKSKNIVVCIVYRPPDQDMNEFNKLTDSLLSKITKNENNHIRGRVKKSLQPSFFSLHGCIYTKLAVSTSSMNLCLSCHVTWTVLHAWLHYGISIKTMHFGHC